MVTEENARPGSLQRAGYVTDGGCCAKSSSPDADWPACSPSSPLPSPPAHPVVDRRTHSAHDGDLLDRRVHRVRRAPGRLILENRKVPKGSRSRSYTWRCSCRGDRPDHRRAVDGRAGAIVAGALPGLFERAHELGGVVEDYVHQHFPSIQLPPASINLSAIRGSQETQLATGTLASPRASR